jgi:hypothetical protein
MNSGRASSSFDLGRDLPTTPDDVEARRRLQVGGGSTEEYLRFLSELGDASAETLRKRRLPRGDPPFELTPRGATR